MKIPLYQRQTALTRDSGARPLSAMASPGAYAQPANAAFQMGQAISGVGDMVGDIAIAEEKQENARVLAAEENKLTDYIQTTKADAVTGEVGKSSMVPDPSNPGQSIAGPPETQSQHFQRLQSDISKRIKAQASRISDRNVRQRFNASASTKMQAAMPGIRTQLRLRYLDAYQATRNENTTAVRKEVSNYSVNNPVRRELVESHKRKIIQEGLANGEKQTVIQKAVRTFESDTLSDFINSELLNASEANDLNRINQLQLQVQNHADETSPFFGLLPDVAIRLEKRISDQYEREERRMVLGSEKKEKDDKRQAKDREEKTVRDITAAIGVARARGERPKITSTNIELLNLPREKKNQLQNYLVGRDVIFNPSYVAEVKGEIREAVEDGEIEDILETAKNDRDGGRIGLKAYEEIEQEADAALKKSPESIERKNMEAFLKNALGLNDTQFYASSKGPQLLARRNQVLINYNYHLSNKLRPAEAAMRALTQAATKERNVMGNLANELPNVFTQNVLRKNDGKIEVSAAAIAKIKENWERQFEKSVGMKVPEDTTPENIRKLQKTNRAFNKRERLTARALFEVESRINAIERLYVQEQRALEKVKEQLKNSNTEEERSGFKKFLDLFPDFPDFGSPSSDTVVPGQSINR